MVSLVLDRYTSPRRRYFLSAEASWIFAMPSIARVLSDGEVVLAQKGLSHHIQGFDDLGRGLDPDHGNVDSRMHQRGAQDQLID